ncbi:MAG: hypothetical protein AB2588_13040 [Candidatus Thiodiazotropha sp.]
MITYYTFEGPIISLDDRSGLLMHAGINVNDNVRYTFLVNRELEGTRIEDNGSRHTYDNDRLRVYFFANLISCSRIEALIEDAPHSNTPVVTYYRGFESNKRFDLLSGSSKHYVNIWGVSINDWPYGPTLHGLECVNGKNSKRSVVSSKLSLTSISDRYSNPFDSEFLSSKEIIHPLHH